MQKFVSAVGQQALENQSKIKKISAEVVDVNSSNTRITVKLLDKSNSTITLYNKSGEILSVGESVWIHYWKSVTDGYVALRCGVPSYSSGIIVDGVPYTGELPIRQITKIGTANVLTEGTTEYQTNYTYQVTDQSGSGALINADVGEIFSEWSSEFNHNSYMTSCTMFYGSILHFAWVPRRVGTGTSASAEAGFHVYDDITVPEIVNNEIVRRRYYIKAVQQQNSNTYSVYIAMAENGTELSTWLLGNGVLYEDISKYKFIFVVGSTQTDEGDTGHIIEYNPYVHTLVIGTTIYQAYYNENTGLWGVLQHYDTFEKSCYVAGEPDHISVRICKKTVTQSKERGVMV